MSTKLIFKRVALVAAVALAVGGITAVSAQAVPTNGITSDSFTAAGAATASTTTTVGTASTVALTYTGIATNATDVASLGGSVMSSPITSAGSAVSYAATVGATSVNDAGTVGSSIATTASGRVTYYVTASYTPDVVGTYVVKLTSAGALNNTFVTWTITASAVAAADAAHSTTNLNLGATNTGAADVAAPVVASTAGLKGGVIFVTSKNSAGTDLSASTVLSATVTGPGSISIGAANTGAGSSGRAVTGAAGNQYIAFYGDGTSGVGTITISAGSTVLATRNVTFFGIASKLTLTAINGVIDAETAATATTNLVTANNQALTVVATDINGKVVPLVAGGLTITPGSLAIVASGVADQNGVHFAGGGTTGTACSVTDTCITLNGVHGGIGTSTITVTDTATGLVSNSVTVRTSSGVPTSVVFSTDAASYATGANGTLTETVKDASGTLPAGTYTVFSGAGSVKSSMALSVNNLPTTATLTVNDSGVVTQSINAPLSDGTTTISATGAAGVTITPVSFAVTSGTTSSIKEAVDAANAATAAATAAGVLASQAVQAAKDAGAQATAATAAVAALSVRVTNVLAKIAALSKLILRLIKKAHA